MKDWLCLLFIVLALPGMVHAAPAEQEEWERVLGAAKKEGKVTVIADVTADIRDSLTTAFQGKYGIPVEYFGVMGREISPRVSTERKAGRYIWDVYVHGTTTGLTAMVPLGAFDPLEPALLFPDVKEPKNWRGGGLEFADSGRQLLVTSLRQRGIIFVNPNLVNPKEFKSYKDLLQPKWRGKIAMDDPTRAGPGQATFTFFYMHPDLGPNFIRALAKQQIVVLRDYGQEVDAVGQGRFLALIGTADFVATARIRQGVPVVIVDPSQLKEGSDLSSGNGAVALFNRAPHPNAARVYINWFLSKEGQTVFARGTGYVSARLDVPTDHAEPWQVPVAGAIKTYGQQALDTRAKVVDLVKEVFGL